MLCASSELSCRKTCRESNKRPGHCCLWNQACWWVRLPMFFCTTCDWTPKHNETLVCRVVCGGTRSNKKNMGNIRVVSERNQLEKIDESKLTLLHATRLWHIPLRDVRVKCRRTLEHCRFKKVKKEQQGERICRELMCEEWQMNRLAILEKRKKKKKGKVL